MQHEALHKKIIHFVRTRPVQLLLSTLVCVYVAYQVFSASMLMSAVLFGIIIMVVLPSLFVSWLLFYAIGLRSISKLMPFLAAAILVGLLVGKIMLQIGDNSYWNTVGDENIKRADTVIAALKAFEKDTGFYPEHTTDLVPAYLEEVPVTLTGEAIMHSRTQSASDCVGEPDKYGIYKQGECKQMFWGFKLRLPGYRFPICYEFSHNLTEAGYSEYPWSMCDVGL